RRIKAYLRKCNQQVADQIGDEPAPNEEIPARIVPRQIPRLLERYIDRNNLEQQLCDLLRDPKTEQSVLVYGMSGTGKSALVTRVLHLMSDTDFPDGILWGSCDQRDINDLLLHFLGALDSVWYQNAPRENIALRDVFWRCIEGKSVLIVLDNLKDA